MGEQYVVVSRLTTPPTTNPNDVNHKDDSSVDHDEAIDDDDIADANTFEALSRIQDPPASNTITHVPSANVPPLPPLSASAPDSDHHNYDTVASHGCETSTIVVDPFSSGDAGAPITDDPPSHSDHDLTWPTRESPHQNIWAPFNSQCDWEVAHWAKTHGTTSSAVTELLAIPEVRFSNKLISNRLICCISSLGS